MGKIAILGLGPSISLFNPAEFELSIGVNDIWRFHKTEVIVCLDRKNAFSNQRYETIIRSSPEAFYSQIVNWEFMPGFRKIELTHKFPITECRLDIPQLNKSYCSPFVACQIAFKYYGATEIHLFGVDLIDHPHLNFPLCTSIKFHFANLKVALKKEGCELIVHGDGILTDIL